MRPTEQKERLLACLLVSYRPLARFLDEKKVVRYLLTARVHGPLKPLRISAIHQRDDLRVLGMATSRKSDLQRQLRELDEQRARLMAELRASEQEAAPPSDDGTPSRPAPRTVVPSCYL